MPETHSMLREQYERTLAENARLRDALEDAVNTLEAMNLHAGNPLYNRLVLVLENSD